MTRFSELPGIPSDELNGESAMLMHEGKNLETRLRRLSQCFHRVSFLRCQEWNRTLTTPTVKQGALEIKILDTMRAPLRGVRRTKLFGAQTLEGSLPLYWYFTVKPLNAIFFISTGSLLLYVFVYFNMLKNIY